MMIDLLIRAYLLIRLYHLTILFRPIVAQCYFSSYRANGMHSLLIRKDIALRLFLSYAHSNSKLITMKVLKSSVIPHGRQCERVYNLRRPTAFGKMSILSTDCHSLQMDGWRHKPFSLWAPVDVAHWIASVADSTGFSVYDIDMTRFQVGGAQLATMSELEFMQGDVQYGRILFANFRLVVQRDASLPVQEPKKRRGRPVTNTQRQRTPKKRFRLWEFLLHLLSDPTHCPSVVEWEKREDGSFRIKQSAKLAELWGHFRGRKNMDYVKLSRLMRYYYKQKVLIADKQRLVYRFGPNADGWKELSQTPAWSEDISTLCLE